MTREQWRAWCDDDPDASGALRAARWVSATSDPELDETEAEKDYREIRTSNRVKFHDMLAELENGLLRTRAGRMKQDHSTPSEAPDIGTQKALALAEQLLKDTLAKLEQTCPHCGKVI